MTQSDTNPHHLLMLTVLQNVSTDRLQRAVNAFADGSMTVTLTRQTEAEIRAMVKNGAEREYGVVLTPTLTTCSCKDALYRGVVCKHTVATALHVLRTPQAKREPQPEPVRTVAPPPRTIHLLLDGDRALWWAIESHALLALAALAGDRLARDLYGVCSRATAAYPGGRSVTDLDRGSMARNRDRLRYEPMYKPRPPGEKPTKRQRLWAAFLRIITLGLVRGRRRSQD